MTQPSPFDNRGAPPESDGVEFGVGRAEAELPHGSSRRLALVTTELAVGGAERCLTQLAVGLTLRGWDVEVYSLRAPPAAAQASLVRQLQDAGVPTHFLHLNGLLSLPRTALRLRSHLARQRPELLQTFLYHANLLGSVAGRWAGVPRVVTGIRVADPRRGRWRCERWFTRSADAIVCVSDSVAAHAREEARLPAEKLTVIPNGVDVARYDGATPAGLAALGVAAGRRLLLSIGRLDPQKGFDWLLSFAPRLFAALPLHDWVVVGEGPQRERLAAQAAAAGVAERVHFVGRRPPEDLPSLLAAADVVLIPSRWEGMPNVLLEAMAAAKPVVATEVEGVREVLGEDAAAQVVACGDEAGFLERAVALALAARNAEPPAPDSDVGRCNRARVAEIYSLDVMVDRYETLYRRLLDATPDIGAKPLS